MNLEDIKKIIHLLDNSSLEELKYKTESGDSLFLSKHSKNAPATVITAPAPISPVAPAAAPAPVTPATPTLAPAPVEASKNTINAKLVGTFYDAPAPEANPFVKAGDTVKKGDLICILEAMKVMNQIHADKSGTIKAVLIENGNPVEYGQPMFELL